MIFWLDICDLCLRVKGILTPSIGRISVLENFRGKSLGSELVKEGLKKSEELYSSLKMTISAQEYLINFYESHGFRVIGEVYDEDGIPHVEMIRNGQK
tara:strand:- start:5740 stop:6033 length:294 start_codon:yes stop_codon:yes gene_type:complete